MLKVTETIRPLSVHKPEQFMGSISWLVTWLEKLMRSIPGDQQWHEEGKPFKAAAGRTQTRSSCPKPDQVHTLKVQIPHYFSREGEKEHRHLPFLRTVG